MNYRSYFLKYLHTLKMYFVFLKPLCEPELSQAEIFAGKIDVETVIKLGLVRFAMLPDIDTYLSNIRGHVEPWAKLSAAIDRIK